MSENSRKIMLCLLMLICMVNIVTVAAQDEGGGDFSYELETGLEFDPEAPQPNCATLLGQSVVTSGVEEGITINLNPGATSVNPSGVFSGVTFDPNVSGRNAVAILVIDQFTSPLSSGYVIPSQVFSATSNDDLEQYSDDGTLTHGAQVFNHINALLAGVLIPSGYTPNPDLDQVEWSNGVNRVVVKMVDAMIYDQPTPTPVMQGVIANAILDLANDGINYFVFNMSFAVVPCAVAEHYQVERVNFPTFMDYTIAVETTFPGLSADLLITPVDPDPLHGLITTCSDLESEEESPAVQQVLIEQLGEEIAEVCSAVQAVHVGSAGNSQQPFPFYPAAWAEVTSVSAAENGSLATYSNFNANKGLVGGWFQLGALGLSPPGILNFVTTPVYYQGTSFSGPVESVCVALDLDDTVVPGCDSISGP